VIWELLTYGRGLCGLLELQRWGTNGKKVGDGTKIRFWGDLWLGSSSLAIQFWEIYCIVNEQNRNIADLLDGVNLKCIFRRCVDVRLYNMWEGVISIAESLNLTAEEDELIWMYNSSRIYSSQSPFIV
jgi:hypothetical protein